MQTIKSTENLDKIDFQILDHLQRDGRLSVVELSKRINLSPTPCTARIRRLEEAGVIKGYHAKLDPLKMGQSKPASRRWHQ